MADEQRPYPRPADLATGRGVPEDWQSDGTIVRRGVAHEISIVKEEGDEVLVSGLTFFGWVKRDQVIKAE